MSPSARIPNLDGIRGLACLAVFAIHVGYLGIFSGGYVAMDVFFVLSGFLITKAVMRPTATWTAYRRDRVARIVPGLIPLVVLYGILLGCAPLGSRAGASVEILTAVTFTTNLVWYAGDLHESIPGLFGHFWSLGVEAQFYVLWPFVVWRMRSISSGRLISLALLGFTVNLLEIALTKPWLFSLHRSYFFTESRLWEFVLGALALTVASDERSLGQYAAIRNSTRLPWLALLGLCTAPLGAAVAESTLWSAIVWPCVAAGSMAVILVYSQWGRRLAPVDLSALRWLGARSYGFYLWHLPVVVFAGEFGLRTHGRGVFIGTCLAITLILASVSYSCVEQPLGRRWCDVGRRQRLASKGSLVSGQAPTF